MSNSISVNLFNNKGSKKTLTAMVVKTISSKSITNNPDKLFCLNLHKLHSRELVDKSISLSELIAFNIFHNIRHNKRVRHVNSSNNIVPYNAD